MPRVQSGEVNRIGIVVLFDEATNTLELLAAAGGSKMVEDEYIRYPVRLERALMEGSYDRVWGEITGERVPGEEFSVFSEVSSVLLMF